MKWLIALLGLFAVAATARADALPGMDEVRELGRLNGLALACSQQENMKRIKALMIAHAPKSRSHGAAFEESTQEAFLQRSAEPSACGDDPVIALQAEAVAGRLQAGLTGGGAGK